MKRYKALIITDKLNIGGYDLVAYNFAKNMNSNKYEFVFLIRGEDKGILEDTVLANGFRVVHQPDKSLNYFKSYNYFKRLITAEEFDIVHSHLNFFSAIVMRAAYNCGVKVRAAHAHFTDPCIENRGKIKTAIATVYEAIMRVWFKRYCNLQISCGYEAGTYLFGKKQFEKSGIIVNNGVDINRFNYNVQSRKEIRTQYNIDNKIVIGHCGRFNYVKNHKFLLDVFSVFNKICPESVLLLVGDGGEKENIIKKAKELRIDKQIIITGLVNNTEDYYCAMDCFVFPSIHEGFPLTLVEAQATKLPCLVSSEVTPKVKINNNVSFLSLDDSAETWAEKIQELIKFNRQEIDLSSLYDDFDLRNCSKKLDELYGSLL